MNTRLEKRTDLSFWYGALWIIFITSFIFSFRAVTSIGIGVLLVAGVIKNRLESKPFFHPRWKNPFLIGCALFYFLQVLSIVYTHNQTEGWDHARIKSGLLFIPIAVCCTDYLYSTARPRIFLYYCLLVTAASLYCGVVNFIHYQQTSDSSFFFYHLLVRPLSGHAVFFSILVFIALVHLLEDQWATIPSVKKWIALPIVLFLSGFLFLLSSKLVIAFYLLYMIAYFIRALRRKKHGRSLVIVLFLLFIGSGTTILVTHNRVEERFRDITYWDTRWMHEGQYSPGDYFNGLQFRLLQWKLVPEILNEQHAWVKGVGPGDAQSVLDGKYISRNMYTGDPSRKGDRGYLGYHTHDQLLESLLQNGIIGAILYLLICFSLLRIAWRNKSWMTRFIIILLFVWSFTDAVFETQYGLLIFTFFPLFLDPEK